LHFQNPDHVLAIIDPVSLKVIAKVPVGSDPHELLHRPTEKRLILPSMAAAACTT